MVQLCKSERSVLALEMGPFRGVKYSSIFPLIRANTVQLPWADLHPRAEISPSVGWNRLSIWGCFGLNRVQMAPGKAESDFGLHGLISALGLKQIFFNFQCSCTNFCVLQTKSLLKEINAWVFFQFRFLQKLRGASIS